MHSNRQAHCSKEVLQTLKKRTHNQGCVLVAYKEAHFAKESFSSVPEPRRSPSPKTSKLLDTVHKNIPQMLSFNGQKST